MLKPLCFLATIALAFSGEIEIFECDNQTSFMDGFLPLAIRVDGCSDSSCQFKAGQIVEMEIDFISNQDNDMIGFMTRSMFGTDVIVFDGYIDYTKACDFIEPSCPVKEGKKYTFKGSGQWIESVPSLKGLNVTAALQGQNGKKLTKMLIKFY